MFNCPGRRDEYLRPTNLYIKKLNTIAAEFWVRRLNETSVKACSELRFATISIAGWRQEPVGVDGATFFGVIGTGEGMACC